MSDRPIDAAFECDECGYPLTSLAQPGQSVRCPECGRTHPWPPPLPRRPWPGAAAMVAGTCGPCAGLMVVVLGLAAIPGARIALAVMSSVLLFAWFCAVVVPPAFFATEFTRHCLLRPRRRVVALPLALAGMGGNILISLVGLWVALVIWG